jgi:hypothetical protein
MARKYSITRDRPVELFRRGRPILRALLGSLTMRGAEGEGEGAVEPGWLTADYKVMGDFWDLACSCSERT